MDQNDTFCTQTLSPSMLSRGSQACHSSKYEYTWHGTSISINTHFHINMPATQRASILCLCDNHLRANKALNRSTSLVHVISPHLNACFPILFLEASQVRVCLQHVRIGWNGMRCSFKCIMHPIHQFYLRVPDR